MPVKRTLLSQPRRNVGVDDGGVSHGGVLRPLLVIQARINLEGAVTQPPNEALDVVPVHLVGIEVAGDEDAKGVDGVIPKKQNGTHGRERSSQPEIPESHDLVKCMGARASGQWHKKCVYASLT